MSIEDDLNAFRDLALEEQIRTPSYLAEGDDPDEVCGVVCDALEDILFDIVGNTKVALTGEVYVPVCDEDGNADGMRLIENPREPVFGDYNGLDMVNTEDMPALKNVQPGQFVVGYSVYVESSGSVDSGFAFAPIRTSTLMVLDLIVPMESILPAEDDEIAEQIDLCMSAEVPGLQALCDIFDQMKDASHMQIEYYLNYLNRIMPLDTYDTTISTDKMLIGRVGEPISERINPDNGLWELPIQPTSFEYIYPNGLCMKVDYMLGDPDYDEFVFFPISSMQKLQFRDRKDDESTAMGPEMN